MSNFFYRVFWILIFVLCLCLFIYINFFKRVKNEDSIKKHIALFVPGVISGSPSYKEIHDSVLEFSSSDNDVQLKIFEAGFEQNEWENLLEKLLSSKKYNFLITMNNAMQYLVDKISLKYPDTKFLLFDSFVKNSNPQVYSLSYNVSEEAYILGYYVGLFLKEKGLEKNNVALISGQKYPVMNEYIEPYFKKGVNEVINSEVFFRVLGNWYDSNKAKSISDSLITSSNVKVILPIVGSAVEGVISSVRKNDAYVVLFDSENYLTVKDNIIGSGITNQKLYVIKVLKDAFNDKLDYGTYSVVGVKDNGVSFNFDNKFYLEKISVRLKKMMEDKMGDISLNGILIELK